MSDAKAGTSAAGARGNVRNNFGIDCAIVAGVFGGGACDGEAVRALENVGVIVADGGGQRSGGEPVAEQMAFHGKGARERVGLVVDGDVDVAAPGAGGEDREGRVDARSSSETRAPVRVGGDRCERGDSSSMATPRARQAARRAVIRARGIDDGLVGVVDGADGVGPDQGDQRAEFVARENRGRNAGGSLESGAPGERFELGVGEGDLDRAGPAEFDGQAAVGFERGDELLVLREAADREIEQGRRLVEFAAGREHSGRGGAGFGADFRGIQQQDAELVAGQPPGDGCADDAAAGDDDVEAYPAWLLGRGRCFERIHDGDGTEFAASLKILTEQKSAPSALGGGDNHTVPESHLRSDRSNTRRARSCQWSRPEGSIPHMRFT